ncbi:hypothetical protein ABH931_007112 [Streptacidiphilus sp. MAP12-33]|uniref:hypothetical protein n=1 Tax=Streptacidiphilus sp. MAP12-33 TaxID=3156266 RepID=UPI003513A691
MSAYELRAEHRPANPGRRVGQWHIVPARRLTGLCRRLTEPVADVRPIADAWAVEAELRCPQCWARYAAETAELPAGAGSRLSPSAQSHVGPGPGPGRGAGPGTSHHAPRTGGKAVRFEIERA